MIKSKRKDGKYYCCNCGKHIPISQESLDQLWALKKALGYVGDIHLYCDCIPEDMHHEYDLTFGMRYKKKLPVRIIVK